MADVKLLLTLCLSLLLSSVAVSLITGGAAATLGDFNIYEPVSVNLTGNDTLDYKVDIVSRGAWIRSSEGLVSGNDGVYNVLYLNTQWPKNGEYTNTYRVYNPDFREYELIVRETYQPYDTIRARVTSQGIYVETETLLGVYTAYQTLIPFGVSALGHEYTIKTVLDETDRTVAVYLDSVLIGTAQSIPEDSLLSWGTNRYSGISVYGSGFKLLTYASTGEQYNQAAFDIFAFAECLGEVMGWYTSSGVPVVDIFINIVIKLQQIGIGVIIVTIIRGD